MSKDSKALLKYLGIMFIAVLLMYKLPQDSYTVVEYIIRPIPIGNGVLTLAGIVPVGLFILGFFGMCRLERFAGKNKVALFIILVLLVLPVMKGSVDAAKRGYYWLTDNGLETINLQQASIMTSSSQDRILLTIHLELVDYGKTPNSFRVKVYPPATLKEILDREFIEFDGSYTTHGGGSSLVLQHSIDLYDRYDWNFLDTYVFELYNDETWVRLKHRQ